jgi:hypothetical protein
LRTVYQVPSKLGSSVTEALPWDDIFIPDGWASQEGPQ